MIIDSQTLFSDRQVVTASAISTNVMDLTLGQAGLATVDFATCGQYLYLQVIAAVTATGSATVTFSLESDSTENLASAPTVHWTSTAIGKATLVAGYEVVKIRLPKGLYKRYLGVRYIVASGPLTAGSFLGCLVLGVRANTVAFASGYAIS